MNRRRLIDLHHPGFRPVWVRVAVVVVCIAWGLFELSNLNNLWGIVFIGIGVVCAYRFATIDYSAPDDGAD